MIFLTVDEVLRINERLLGPGQLRDRGLLESAVERPKTTIGGEDAYPDVHTKAAALFHSIASNHAFVDGGRSPSLRLIWSESAAPIIRADRQILSRVHESPQPWELVGATRAWTGGLGRG